MMREILNLSLRLCLIAMLSGLVLGVSHNFTKDQIHEHAVREAEALRIECLPEADSFEDVDIGSYVEEYPYVRSVYRGLSLGEEVGYVFDMSVRGYNSGLELGIGISSKGEPCVTRVIAGANQETPGLGTKALDLARLAGYDNSSLGSAKVDAISGATTTSNAVQSAVDTAISLFGRISNTEGAAE